MEKKKSMLLKLLVPLLIVIIVGTMWFLKNSSMERGDENSVTNADELPEHLQDADFSLIVTKAVDFTALAEYGLPAIIDYGADSCIPCKEMAPVLTKLNEEMYGKAFIKFADVWDAPDAASNVPVQVIPTQVLMNRDGTPFVPSDELAEQIAFTMYNSRETGAHVFTVHQGGLTEEQMRAILEEMEVVWND